jgi:predicted PurR-regulated permease PerM
MNIYSENQRRFLLIVLMTGLALFLSWSMISYIGSFFGCFILYAMFRDLNLWFRKKGFSDFWAALTVLLISVVVVIIPFFLLSLMLTQKIIYYSKRTENLIEVYNKAKAFIDQYNYLAIDYSIDFNEYLPKIAQAVAAWASNLFPSLLSSTIDIFVGLGISYFIFYYLLANDAQVISGLQRYLPFNEQTRKNLSRAFKNTVNTYVLGQGIISLVQAALLSIGFLIFGFKDAFFWGVVGFFLSFIPFVGTPLIWLPAALIALAEGRMFGGIGMMLYGWIVVTNSDNLMRMFISQKMGDIHPIVTMIGLTFGLTYFGIIGLVVGPLLVSVLLVLFDAFEKDSTERLGISRVEKSENADENPEKENGEGESA